MISHGSSVNSLDIEWEQARRIDFVPTVLAILVFFSLNSSE
jgi:hypothetical protein